MRIAFRKTSEKLGSAYSSFCGAIRGLWRVPYLHLFIEQLSPPPATCPRRRLHDRSTSSLSGSLASCRAVASAISFAMRQPSNALPSSHSRRRAANRAALLHRDSIYGRWRREPKCEDCAPHVLACPELVARRRVELRNGPLPNYSPDCMRRVVVWRESTDK